MPAVPERRTDVLLWMSILLGPVAMGINTIVGFTVAHWTTDTNRKGFCYLVSGVDVVLCICGLLIASSLFRHYSNADELQPESGRRLFMSKLGMLISFISILLVIGQTLAVLILHPTD
jgi:peptidoglycan/LPS O-acetylase OafA/YrhL